MCIWPYGEEHLEQLLTFADGARIALKARSAEVLQRRRPLPPQPPAITLAATTGPTTTTTLATTTSATTTCDLGLRF